MPRRVTSFDVARRAGVSQPTVSRALRGVPGVTPGTRLAVQQAAAELAYVASDRGRALSTQRSNRVAVVSEELTNPFYPQLVEPLRRSLADHGYVTVLITDEGGVDVQQFADGAFDGVVLTTILRRSRLSVELAELGVPHVMVNRVTDTPTVPAVTIDNAAGTQQIAELLDQLGHTRIASLQGPVETSTGRERSRSLRAELRARGVHLPRQWARRVAFSHDAAQAAAREVLSEPLGPTAVVCGNDVIALGTLSAARSLGIDVPGTLTVIGFDDIPMAGWPIANLTTVRCDLERLATRAVAQLLPAMTGDPPQPSVERVMPRLVLRGTHGAAAAATSG